MFPFTRYKAEGDIRRKEMCIRDRRRIAMQMAKLPKGKNVFELNDPRFWQCRNLGANSARAVKKMPFKAIYGENREMSL